MSTELDVQSFIDSAQADVPSDQRVNVPENEYPMFVKPGSTKILTGSGDKGPWAMYTASAVIDDPAARDATNLENPTARIRFFLDLVEGTDPTEKLVLSKGANRNVTLGKLLKATGNDKQGWKFGDVEGVPFKGRVIHRADKRDPERVDAEVVAYARGS